MREMIYKSEQEAVLDIINKVGVDGLCQWDGCECCQFSIRNVYVDINCGRGADRGIWIYVISMDMNKREHDDFIRPIADEVKLQVEEKSWRGPIDYHFHEYKPT